MAQEAPPASPNVVVVASPHVVVVPPRVQEFPPSPEQSSSLLCEVSMELGLGVDASDTRSDTRSASRLLHGHACTVMRAILNQSCPMHIRWANATLRSGDLAKGEHQLLLLDQVPNQVFFSVLQVKSPSGEPNEPVQFQKVTTQHAGNEQVKRSFFARRTTNREASNVNPWLEMVVLEPGASPLDLVAESDNKIASHKGRGRARFASPAWWDLGNEDLDADVSTGCAIGPSGGTKRVRPALLPRLARMVLAGKDGCNKQHTKSLWLKDPFHAVLCAKVYLEQAFAHGLIDSTTVAAMPSEFAESRRVIESVCQSIRLVHHHEQQTLTQQVYAQWACTLRGLVRLPRLRLAPALAPAPASSVTHDKNHDPLASHLASPSASFLRGYANAFDVDASSQMKKNTKNKTTTTKKKPVHKRKGSSDDTENTSIGEETSRASSPMSASSTASSSTASSSSGGHPSSKRHHVALASPALQQQSQPQTYCQWMGTHGECYGRVSASRSEFTWDEVHKVPIIAFETMNCEHPRCQAQSDLSFGLFQQRRYQANKQPWQHHQEQHLLQVQKD
jgi:hypothetical protein